MMKWWRKYRARQRAKRRLYDTEVLWPAIKKLSEGNLQQAKNAFLLHCIIDDNWDEVVGGELIKVIEGLE